MFCSTMVTSLSVTLETTTRETIVPINTVSKTTNFTYFKLTLSSLTLLAEGLNSTTANVNGWSEEFTTVNCSKFNIHHEGMAYQSPAAESFDNEAGDDMICSVYPYQPSVNADTQLALVFVMEDMATTNGHSHTLYIWNALE